MIVNLNIAIRQTTSASAPKLTAFRNLFEAGASFEEALEGSGLSSQRPDTIAVLERQWNRWEAVYNSR